MPEICKSIAGMNEQLAARLKLILIVGLASGVSQPRHFFKGILCPACSTNYRLVFENLHLAENSGMMSARMSCCWQQGLVDAVDISIVQTP